MQCPSDLSSLGSLLIVVRFSNEVYESHEVFVEKCWQNLVSEKPQSILVCKYMVSKCFSNPKVARLGLADSWIRQNKNPVD